MGSASEILKDLGVKEVNSGVFAGEWIKAPSGGELVSIREGYFTRVQTLVFPIREMPMNPRTLSWSGFSRVILHL